MMPRHMVGKGAQRDCGKSAARDAPLPTLVWGLKSQEVILGYVICLSSLISFLVRPRRFFVPTAIWQERRAQTRSSLAEGHRRRRREAGLTASSTARALRGRGRLVAT